MQLVEQRVIKKGHPAYNQIDTMSFAAKNLWNAAQYCVRQSFIYGNGVPSYNQMDKLMQPTEQYKALPAKVAQQVLMLLANSAESRRCPRRGSDRMDSRARIRLDKIGAAVKRRVSVRSSRSKYTAAPILSNSFAGAATMPFTLNAVGERVDG